MKSTYQPIFMLENVAAGALGHREIRLAMCGSGGCCAGGEGSVCSDFPIIRDGSRRLKDDGAPPFFPAIGRRFFHSECGAAPEKIVTPIAAGAVAGEPAIP